MAKMNTLKIYIDSLKKGVNDDDILKLAIESGVLEDEARANLQKSKIKLEEWIKNSDKKKNDSIANRNIVQDNRAILVEKDPLELKTKELISKMEEAKKLCSEVRILREKNHLSSTGISNLARELNNNIKFANRYVENRS